MILPVRRTVKAYITHRQRLLVFRQPDFPDAGIQAFNIRNTPGAQGFQVG